MAKSTAFVGFPEGVLRETPVRLPVLANETDWFALNKFAGLSGQAHPWYTDRQNITGAIRSQILDNKGELIRQSITGVHYICGPEPEFAGPMVFAKAKDSAIQLKNAFGSDQFRFTYWILTDARVDEEEIVCRLPIAAHQKSARALVSHGTGKKSATTFRRLGISRHLNLWQAVTNHPRLHQIRIHASEVGLPVLGDTLYGPKKPFHLRISNGSGKVRIPRFTGLGMVLTEIDISQFLPEVPTISADLPRLFSALLRKYELLEAQ